MFKGSARFGPGEIDRLTQALGGVNNAFTSHDSTAYYFNFAADRWTEALAIEADRMASLTLDPEQVASERQVILEEIAMYESEPWDALEMAVHERLFGPHAYGRPVLGTREELLATGARGPARLPRPLLPAGQRRAGGGGRHRRRTPSRPSSGAGEPAGRGEARRGFTPPRSLPSAIERLERRKGEVARLLLALPRAAGAHPDHPAAAPRRHRARRRPHQPPPARAGRGRAALRLGVGRPLRGNGRQP